MVVDTVVIGDIGGTNSRLEVYTIDRSASFTQGNVVPGTLLGAKTYKNGEFRSEASPFLRIMQRFFEEFLAPKNLSPAAVCLAVAGLVMENSVNMTNLGWVIRGDELATALGVPSVQLINDFVGQGYGLLTLRSEECVELQVGPVLRGAPIACIGAGTGLGEVFLTPTKDGFYEAWPSEGGHAEYAPRSDVQYALLRDLKHTLQAAHRVSVERVVSGTGLANVYTFLVKVATDDSHPDHACVIEYLRDKQATCPLLHREEEAHVRASVAAAAEPGGIIAMHSERDLLCHCAMGLMIEAYGAEAGVAALKWMPFGGLYITGGVTTKNMSKLQDPRYGFLAALCDKGRQSALCRRLCVRAVLPESVGLRGTLYYAFKILRQTQQQVQQQPAAATVARVSECKVGHCNAYTYMLAAAAAGAVLGFALGKVSRA